MNIKKIIIWIPFIIWTVIIFLFSSQNGEVSSGTSNPTAEFLASIINPSIDNMSEAERALLLDRCQFVVRKLAHFSVYTILGIFSYIAFIEYKRISIKFRILFSAGICFLYAVSDELHQSFVPGRSCELRDVFIDFSGSIFGITVLIMSIAVFRKLKNQSNNP